MMRIIPLQTRSKSTLDSDFKTLVAALVAVTLLVLGSFLARVWSREKRALSLRKADPASKGKGALLSPFSFEILIVF
jgi:hypothetical protein